MFARHLQTIGAIAVLAIAIAGGWLATSQFQRAVTIVPGLQGCWRLEGSTRQVACLSEEFRDGAAATAGDAKGVKRDRAVISYVRRAERLAAGDPRLAATCHPSMHQLGRDQGRRAAAEQRVPQFPGGSSQLCTAGYVHGLSEGYLEGTASADVAAVFPQLCSDPASRSGCAHGVGHALVLGRGSESPVEAATAAAGRCEDLPDEFPTNCQDGAYMELAMRTEPEPVTVDDYVGTCRTATAGRELACWGYLGQNLASNDVPLDQVPASCAKATLPGQFPCIDGYGRELGVARVSRCGSASRRPALQERCVDGAIGLQIGSGHVSRAEARSGCGTIARASLQDYCRSAVQRYLRGKAAVESA